MSEKATNKRVGRPTDTFLAEDLAALLILAGGDSVVTPSSLARLLGVTPERAARALEIVGSEQPAGNEGSEDLLPPMLPLYAADPEGGVARLKTPLQACRTRLRLTPSQAEALGHALDRLGIEPESPLRTRVMESFGPTDQRDGGGEVREAGINPPREHTPLDQLLVFARALSEATADDEAPLVSEPEIEFSYQGDNDPITRTRRAVPRSIRLSDGEWFIDAFDTDAHEARTFRASRIQDAKSTGKIAKSPRRLTRGDTERTVRVTVWGSGRRLVASWPGARTVLLDENRTVVDVPYFRGDWLPRQIASLGSLASCDDEAVMGDAKAIAAEDLALGRSLRQKLASNTA